jgi:hypothetical protein
MLNVSMWIVIAGTILTPFIGVLNYQLRHSGSITVAVLSGASLVIALWGFLNPSTKTVWFIVIAVVSLLLFGHAWRPIVGIPIQS